VCTFSPKTNKGEIKCKMPLNEDPNVIFQMGLNNPPYGYPLVPPNYTINIDKSIDNNNFYLNDQFSKTNPLLYRGNQKLINAGNNSFNDYKYLTHNYLLKDKRLFYYNNIFDLNNKNPLNNMPNNNILSFINKNNNNSFIEENLFSKTSRNCYYIKKSKTTNKSSSSACLRNPNKIYNNLDFDNNNQQQILNNIIPIENNNNYLNENINSLFRTVTYIKKKDNNLQQKSNKNKNIEKEIKNKSLNDIYNNKDNEIINNNMNQNKNKNCLYKNGTNIINGINPIKIFSCRNYNNYERVLYDPIYRNQTINSNRLYKELSSPYLNNTNKIKKKLISNNINNHQIIRHYDDLNCINTNSDDIMKNAELNNLINKNNINKCLYKKDYYYTFRKGKIPYNSFNYSSKKKYNKNNLTKNQISLKEVPRKARVNQSNNRINSFYLNNYNKNICRIKSNTFNKKFNSIINNNNKGSFSDLTCRKDSTRQFSNTNYNSHYDTKGCSISSFSLCPTKSPKDNISIKYSGRKECNNSIPNSKPKSNSITKLNNIKKKFKKKSKQNIRKFINSINNNNIENKLKNKRNGLNYCCSNEKNNGSKNDNLEIDYKVVNECIMNPYNSNRKSTKSGKFINTGTNGKNDKSMTLQSLSDSKMMDLAEHFIKGEDSLDQMDMKMIELRKNIKKEKTYRDLTFG
jgi:hypothetical protein